MFCPKCGKENPETGKFCRSCGTDLGNISQALSGALLPVRQVVDHKGRPISWDRAIVKIFSGIAFLAVAIALSFSIGKGWWFWMLIPAFTSLGAGVSQLVQLKKAERGSGTYTPTGNSLPPQKGNPALPPQPAQWAPAESRYTTGDYVPPSVTEGTTRHLDVNSEGQTMTLPKK